jgi:hypothetical protein
VHSVLKLGIYIEMHFVDVFRNIITFIEPSKYIAEGKVKIMSSITVSFVYSSKGMSLNDNRKSNEKTNNISGLRTQDN